MLIKQPWLNYADCLEIELLQSKDEGKDISSYEERIINIKSMDSNDPEREKMAAAILDEFSKLPVTEGYQYDEPSTLELIKMARPKEGKTLKTAHPDISDDSIFDKVFGAWLGRCAGCLLGKPLEGFLRERIMGLLKETGNYPITYYISSNVHKEIAKKYEMNPDAAWIDKVPYAPEDDDTNYTLIGLKILEKYGKNFIPDNVGETWLNDLPILHVCTAERVAYKNLVNLILPPLSASFRNPYREWIGAQIRADFFGYITPGDPELGAELAWRDASISHTKNGIYGEMFVAAMLSVAFIKNEVEAIISIGLSQIPEKSRLYKEINRVLDWKQEGIDWECAIERVHEKYNEKNGHDWCHTVSNAMIVCIGLLFGDLDFEKSIGIAVSAGFDTDCNGATVGSIVGLILGAKVIPNKWKKPLNNKLKSGVDGFGLVEISEIAERTVKIIKDKA